MRHGTCLARAHMMRTVFACATSLALAATVVGCLDDSKVEPEKGEVDEESPPTDPTSLQAPGKGDTSNNVVSYVKESAHPYANNANQTFALDFATVLPSCATQARLHFSTLRTEAGYDYVIVRNGAGSEVQRFDGTKDNTWSSWVTLSSTKSMSVKLTSDSSITKDGFRIDQVEWQGTVTCPAPPDLLCSDDSIDLRRPAPACGCREISHCTPLTTVKISHTTGGGFTGAVSGKKLVGTTMNTSAYTPSTSETLTPVGTVDPEALKDFLNHVATTGVLYGQGRSESANWTECFSITTDQETISYCAEAGSHTPAVVDAITRFELLTSCSSGGSLQCDSGRACDANGACAPSNGCVCPALYNPVCATNGSTYGNSCSAGCAGATVKHTGECGITGDTCGTIRGLGCQTDYKCRYGASQWQPPFPDAGGSCVAATYCESNATAQTDCAGLIHPAVLGQWTCPSNVCTYQPGPPPWNDFAGGHFATAHPYANNVAQWFQVYLPEGATSLRLSTVGTFALENNYDFLEVWTWTNNTWTRAKRYTGTTGPALGDTFTGRYFYLKFVSDSTQTAAGFDVLPQYR